MRSFKRKSIKNKSHCSLIEKISIFLLLSVFILPQFLFFSYAAQAVEAANAADAENAADTVEAAEAAGDAQGAVTADVADEENAAEAADDAGTVEAANTADDAQDAVTADVADAENAENVAGDAGAVEAANAADAENAADTVEAAEAAGDAQDAATADVSAEENAAAADDTAAADELSAYEMKGKSIGVITGGSTSVLITDFFDGDLDLQLFNSNVDMALALNSGKIDAYVTDMYSARDMSMAYEGQYAMEPKVASDPAGFIFKKDDEAAAALKGQINEYLAEIKADGTWQEIYDIWMNYDEDKKVVDMPTEGKNGTLTMATSSNIGNPFCYMKNGSLVGFEIDIAARFCHEYGYALQIEDYDYSALVAAVTSGKVDFAGDSIMQTEARLESVDFSDATCEMGFVLVAKKEISSSSSSDRSSSFLDTVKTSFIRTFVEENRYLLFINGILTTLLIVVLSIIFGSALGFFVFMLCRRGNKAANKITGFFSWLIHGMPVVVLLMILYYIIFASSKISGTAISIIAFTLVFAVGVIAMLRSGVAAIDPGQIEAAQALGYRNRKAFFKLILPQAAMHFMPAYKAEIVSLIKATAVVGYIAVQDLTKIGDLIRSRTFEAFFPLIATAIIYFLLAALLNFFVKRLELKIDTRRRSEKQILKGAILK